MLHSQLPNEEQNRARSNEKFAKVRVVRSETRYSSYTQLSGFSVLVKTCVGITTSHSVPINGIAENAVRRIKEDTSALLVRWSLSEK